MFIISRIFSRLTLKCLCSVFIGLVVVTMFSKALSFFGGVQDPAILAGAPFMFSSESENTLQNFEARLALEGERLSKIAPAAGQ